MMIMEAQARRARLDKPTYPSLPGSGPAIVEINAEKRKLPSMSTNEILQVVQMRSRFWT